MTLLSARLSRRSVLAVPAIALAVGSLAATPGSATGHRSRTALRIRGGDISFTPQLEAAGIRFRDHGAVRPVEQILARRGATHVRLRVWTAPPAGYSDEASALAMAQRAKRAGLKVLLDLHYSDFWADPGHQDTPVAWQGQDLADAGRHGVRLHPPHHRHASPATARPVDIVQIGNEVTAGMLWPVGQIYRPDGAHFPEFCTLLKAGIAGARAGNPRRHRLEVMVHIDRGGDNGGFQLVLRPHRRAGRRVRPHWTVVLPVLARTDRRPSPPTSTTWPPGTASRIVVVETAYPGRSTTATQLENFITSRRPDARRGPVSGDALGQAAYFEALRTILARCRTASAPASSTGPPSGSPASAGLPARATPTTTSPCSTGTAADSPPSPPSAPPPNSCRS